MSSKLEKSKKMKEIIFVLMLSLTFHVVSAQKNTDINKVFNTKFEHGLISKGDNFPDFYVDKDSIDYLLFCLHENISISAFKGNTNFDDEKINNITSFLISKNWLHTVNSLYKPTIFIASDNDGKALYEYAIPISNDIVAAIKNSLPQIKSLFSKTDISKSQNFNQWSFLILSNVLMDSWQIDDVEKHFLMQETRPNRHGKNYYYAIREHTESDKEAFGIYGNQMQSKDNRTFSVYGNNRINGTTQVYNEVSSHDNKIFSEMATSFLPELLDVLKKHRLYIETTYKELGYADEISFEEFFIWWYHFIYTQTTDKMEKEGLLQIPESGNFHYVIIAQ